MVQNCIIYGIYLSKLIKFVCTSLVIGDNHDEKNDQTSRRTGR